MTLSLTLSRLLADIVEEGADRLGIPMVTAVVDAAGHLLYFARMDGSLQVSVQVAQAKAYTASVLRLPTGTLHQLAQPGRELYGIQHLSSRITLIGGGEPLVLNGETVGGIGVSGGTPGQDMALARSAVEALAGMERLAMDIQPLVRTAPLKAMPRGTLEEILVNAAHDTGLSMDNVRLIHGAIRLASEAMPERRPPEE